MEWLTCVLLVAVLVGFAQPQYARSRPHLVLASGGVIIAILLLALAQLPLGGIFRILAAMVDALTAVLLIAAASGNSLQRLISETIESLRSL